ncbi:MAG: carboxypeptidase regulatory-like domain-containing protein, partial [Promethearchaeota archaeon]
WTVSESGQHDWAVLTLDRNGGIYTGWMGRTTAGSSSSIYTDTMNIAGYPTDLSSGNRMYFHSEAGDGATSNNHYYWADTFGGMSGGPVWRYTGGNRYIMTVHAYGRGGTDSNYGTRLNSDKYDRIFTWLGADSAPTDRPDMEDRGSAWQSATSGTITAGVTSFTVSNDVRNVGTASTGGFWVHYYASTNNYISTSDYLIGSDYVSSVSAFNSGSASWTGTFPASIPAGVYYIGWIIDKDNSITEFDEANNKAYIGSPRTVLGAPPPSGYIEVRVRDSPTSNFLQSALVQTYETGTTTLVDSGYTDINGFYNVTGLEVGGFDVKVSANGYHRDEKYNYINWDGDDDYLYFYLIPMPLDSGYIEVNVKDSSTSNPLSSAYIQVTNMSSGLVIDTGYTDGSGFYNATGLWIGWYEVSVSRSGYRPSTKQNYINWNGDDDYLTFYLDPMPPDSGYIEVRVYNETGDPRPNAFVECVNDTSGLLIRSGFTDVNGIYNVTGLTVGWYIINVTYTGYYEQSKSNYINWAGDDDYLSFFLMALPPDSGYIEVNIFDSDTILPISSALIECINQSSGLIIQSGYTDPSGFFKIVNLTIGWYTIVVTRAGYHGQSIQDYIDWVGDDDYLNFYLVELPPDSGYIEVLVKDSDTLLPIINASVACYYSNGTFFSSGLTDGSGFLNITGLYIGWYDIVVSHIDYEGDTKTEFINWNGDDDYLSFYITQKPPGWIEVTVFDGATYNPIANAYVRCYDTSSGELINSGYTDSMGFYNVTGLLVGWWTVNVSFPGYTEGSLQDYIDWRGDDDYLSFYIYFDIPVFTGSVAIFRDILPWNLNLTEPILIDNGISYDVYDSLDFDSADLAPYKKVIIPSDQTQTFYDRLAGNSSWFEDYVANGGVLDLRAADQGWGGGNWDGYHLPGGLNKTFVYIENISINLPNHPLVNTPYLVEDSELDGWLYSAHGYFHEYPTEVNKILIDPFVSEPVLIEFMLGSGFIIATMQTLEWNENKNLTRLLENMILYDPFLGFDSINVTTPLNSDSWFAGSIESITWDSTGTITNVKIDLYKNNIFIAEIVASTPNDGLYSWLLPAALSSATDYQIKISDVTYSLTDDLSENFTITSLGDGEIPGYDLLLLCGILIGISLIVLKKKWKNRAIITT